MALTIKLDLPRDIEERLRAEGVNVDAQVKEAFAVELFRRLAECLSGKFDRLHVAHGALGDERPPR